MKKNLAKLVKKVITDKRGKKTTVWVKMGEAKDQPKKKESPEGDGKVKISAEQENKLSSILNVKEGNDPYDMQFDGEEDFAKYVKDSDKDNSFKNLSTKQIEDWFTKKITYLEGEFKNKPKQMKELSDKIVALNEKMGMPKLEETIKKIKGVKDVSRREMGYGGGYSYTLPKGGGEIKDYLGKPIKDFNPKDFKIGDDGSDDAFGTIEFTSPGGNSVRVHHSGTGKSDSYGISSSGDNGESYFNNGISKVKLIALINGIDGLTTK